MKISIDNLTFKTIIGILPFERTKKQKVIIDISFDYSYNKNKKDFIDYSEITTFVKKTMIKKKFELIEEAILYIQKKLTKKYPIKNLHIKITKPNILNNCIVGVSN